MKRCPTCHRAVRRSTAANARYWALLHRVAERLRIGGSYYSAETWHYYFKSKFLGANDVALPSGEVLTIPHSTAALDAPAFGKYMEKVEAWAARRDVFLEDLAA